MNPTSGGDTAATLVDAGWMMEVAARLQRLARVRAPVTVLLDQGVYERAVGRRLDASQLGDADRSTGCWLVWVRSGLDADETVRVLAHEVGHHAWWSYGHRPLFHARVARLIERCEAELGSLAPFERGGDLGAGDPVELGERRDHGRGGLAAAGLIRIQGAVGHAGTVGC